MAVDLDSKNTAFIDPYLPRILLDWYHQSEPGMIHDTTRHRGIVACIDASGFTRLTRDLSVDKKLGPEKLTEILNRFFSLVTDAIVNYRGDILKFAGDAVWIYFPDSIDIVAFFNHTLALINKLNTSSSYLKNAPISIHMGAEYGSFGLASLGRVNYRLEAEPFGAMIENVMHACDLAQSNQLVVGEELARLVPKYDSLPQPEPGYYLLEPGDQTSEILHKDIKCDAGKYLSHDIRLEQYLSHALIERAKLTTRVAISHSEFRDVVVLFANLRFPSLDESGQAMKEIAAVNKKLAAAFEFISESGGIISRIDPFYDGHKLMVLFGTPRKREGDELNAIHCAVKFLELADSEFDLRIGLAGGLLFCGDVGTDWRREYTVMGEAVNMAARLMASTTWGTILINQCLRKKLPTQIKTGDTRLSFKGIGENILCHQFREITEHSAHRIKSDTIVGMKTERNLLESLLQPKSIAENDVIAVTGGAGVGKSTLVGQAVDSIYEIPTISVSGRHSFLYGQAWVARKLLKKAYSIFKKRPDQSLKDYIAEVVGTSYFPLLGEFIGVSIEDNIWTKGLTQKQKSTKAAELYGTLLASLISTPTAIAIDDFDQIDDFSRLILLDFFNQPEKVPVTFIIISREEAPLSELTDTKLTHLKLNVPRENEWKGYFESRFADGKRELELSSRVINISNGNPRFITEYINNLFAQQVLTLNEITGKYELIESFSDTEVPASINDIYLSRFDSFSEQDKRLLKTASIFETMFSLEVLTSISNSKDTHLPGPQLDRFVRDKILDYYPENGLYDFSDKSFRSIIYSCLPESYIAENHKKAASYFSSGDELIPSAILAHHYFKSRQWPSAFTFSLKAAKETLKLFALSESSNLFQQCEISLDSSGEHEIPANEIYDFYAHFSSYLVLEGNLDRAYRAIQTWEEFADRNNNNFQKISATLERAQLYWQQSKYVECREVLKSILDHPETQGNPLFKARSLAILAEVERRSGEFTGARDCCRLSIDLYKTLEDFQGLSDVHNRLGLALWGAGKLDEAAENYEQSLEYGKDSCGMIVRAQTSNNLAIIKWEQGYFSQANKLMLKALDITKQIGDRRDEAYVSGNLSSIQKILGCLHSSRNLLLQADMIFKRLKDTHAHNYVVGNLGDLDLIEGDADGAYIKFQEVIEFAEKVDDKELFAECQVRLGEVLFYSGRVQEAETKYRKAIDIARDIDSAEYFMRSAIGLCRLYIGERSLDGIKSLVDETLQKALTCNSILVKNEIGFIKGEVHRLNNNNREANTHFHRSLEYAQQQNVFELLLKSSVRLYEQDESFRDKARKIIQGLAHQYKLDNGPKSWDSLKQSCYYQYFTDTINEIV